MLAEMRRCALQSIDVCGLKEMSVSQLKPNVVCYSATIKACEKGT